jgi:REP element-mobilizing transposase RayT
MPSPQLLATTTRSRGYLPHRESSNPIYFVTYRLADSLPAELIARLRQERKLIEKASAAGTDRPPDRVRLQQLRETIRKAERCLDGGIGRCHMRDSRIAKIVVDSLLHFEGTRHHVLSWCVMPNHVHAIFSPLGGQTLETILHSWKSFSANGANRTLGRTGEFWQREYFDHLIRNEASLQKITQYVLDNPKKAGLKNWPWQGQSTNP